MRGASLLLCLLLAGAGLPAPGGTSLSPSSPGPAPTYGPEGTGAVAVIAHPEVGLDDLTFTELRRLYLGDRQFWPGDVRVTLLVPAPGSHAREVLLRCVYERSEAQYRHYWIAKVFRAEAVGAPKVAASADMAASLVLAIPGAVAVVDAARVPAGVKVLVIGGKQPGQPGYPLR